MATVQSKADQKWRVYLCKNVASGRSMDNWPSEIHLWPSSSSALLITLIYLLSNIKRLKGWKEHKLTAANKMAPRREEILTAQSTEWPCSLGLQQPVPKRNISVSYRSGKKVGAAPTTKERFCRQNTNMAVPVWCDPKDVNYLFGFKRDPTNSRCHIFTDILIFGYSSGRMKWTQLLHRRSQKNFAASFYCRPRQHRHTRHCCHHTTTPWLPERGRPTRWFTNQPLGPFNYSRPCLWCVCWSKYDKQDVAMATPDRFITTSLFNYRSTKLSFN